MLGSCLVLVEIFLTLMLSYSGRGGTTSSKKSRLSVKATTLAALQNSNQWRQAPALCMRRGSLTNVPVVESFPLLMLCVLEGLLNEEIA